MARPGMRMEVPMVRAGAAGGPLRVPNAAFARTSFLDGGNAAYIEQLQDSYLRDPASLDPSWRDFLRGDCRRRRRGCDSAQGPRWKQRGWPVVSRGRTRFGALDGNWAEVETHIGARLKGNPVRASGLSQDDLLRATRDSIHALMMIRAYRMRVICTPISDPLVSSRRKTMRSLHPAAYDSRKPDYTRQIFIDGVLGSNMPPFPEMLKILRRTYCGNHRLRIHAYLRSLREELGCSSGSKARTRNFFHQGRQSAPF